MEDSTIKKHLFYTVLLGWGFFTQAQLKADVSVVGEGWANNSVNTVIFREAALVSKGNTQITAYYDPHLNLILAKRILPQGKWQVHKTQYKGNAKDAHNAISLAIDAKGTVHVSWDHHDTGLRYATGTAPLGLELGPERHMTGNLEKKVSYPQFFALKDKLLFLYRSGESGRGSLVLNSYDPSDGQWTQLHSNLLDGEEVRSAYWQACVDRQGTFHLSWVWRETWDVATNHDMAYARSKDGGMTWEKSTGETYSLPIRAESAEYAWKIPPGSGLINQTGMATDDRGNPYIATYWKEGKTVQYQILYYKNKQWKKINTAFRDTYFELGGGGTKSIPISRPKLLVGKGGKDPLLYLLFRDAERNNAISLAFGAARQKTPWKVMDIGSGTVGQWEPNYDLSLWQREHKLHLFVQQVQQIDGEGLAIGQTSPVKIIGVDLLHLGKK